MLFKHIVVLMQPWQEVLLAGFIKNKIESDESIKKLKEFLRNAMPKKECVQCKNRLYVW